MIQLIYTSTATNWPTEAELINLLEQARSQNLRRQTTGMLLYGNRTYLQVLEGAPYGINSSTCQSNGVLNESNCLF